MTTPTFYFIPPLLEHDALFSTEHYTHVAIVKVQKVHAATHSARLTRPAARKTLGLETLASRRAAVEMLLAEDDGDANASCRESGVIGLGRADIDISKL